MHNYCAHVPTYYWQVKHIISMGPFNYHLNRRDKYFTYCNNSLKSKNQQKDNQKQYRDVSQGSCLQSHYRISFLSP